MSDTVPTRSAVITFAAKDAFVSRRTIAFATDCEFATPPTRP